MKLRLAPLIAVVICISAAVPVNAGCYADYKAKRGKPLELHYGVMQVNSCDAASVTPDVVARLQSHGWTLLKVLSVFEADQPDEKRKKRAGAYYLAF